MSQQISRTPSERREKQGIAPGPHLARVVGHLDPSYMGTLKVRILRDRGNTPGEDSKTYNVKAAFPFFGYTGYEYMGVNDASSSTFDAYNDTQKSYGMWFVPPDVGVVVLIMFVNGDPAQGFWMGCVPSNFANHMVPAIGAASQVDIDARDKERFDTNKPLPVAEINRRRNTIAEPQPQIDPAQIKKPLHPIAERFLEQGLVEDEIRGSTTTSSRRNLPSSVYGISTPGPRDKRPGAKKGTIGSADRPATSFISRLGGTQFVMDDGDERFQRKAPASELPFKEAYADLLAGEKGDPAIPFNEYFRVRTRTGHQILMHNSEDLIYIGNSRGTSWIELTSNGKIDIYAQDSISIHTENDLNVRAERDINMEAGRNVNFRTGAVSQPLDDQIETGRFRVDVAGNFELKVNENYRTTVEKDSETVVRNDRKDTIEGSFDLNTKNNNSFTAGNSTDILSENGTSKITSGKSTSILSEGNNNFTSRKNTNILSEGNHIETADKILMNAARQAAEATGARTADLAQEIKELILHENFRSSNTARWIEDRYQIDPIDSIMKRIPMHEPWPNHENLKPNTSTPKDTDREKHDG